MDRRRSLAKKRGYFEEDKIAAQKLAFGLRSELGSGSHFGHPVGCADYNKRGIGRILIETLLTPARSSVGVRRIKSIASNA